MAYSLWFIYVQYKNDQHLQFTFKTKYNIFVITIVFNHQKLEIIIKLLSLKSKLVM